MIDNDPRLYSLSAMLINVTVNKSEGINKVVTPLYQQIK